MDAQRTPSPLPRFDPDAARIVGQIVSEHCPGSSTPGAWCMQGDLGAVLVRFTYASAIHVLSTRRVRFDLSGDAPLLVVATVPTIQPPLEHLWSEGLGAYVSVRPRIEPVEVLFPQPNVA